MEKEILGKMNRGKDKEGKREEVKKGNGKGKGREGKKGWEGRKGWKVTFWNVAGMGKKDKDFGEGLKERDVMILMETWVEEKG